MSMAVSNFGAEWLVGVNVLCNVLRRAQDKNLLLWQNQIFLANNTLPSEQFQIPMIIKITIIKTFL